MELYLNLANISKDEYEPFINYIIKNIQTSIINEYNSKRAENLENYINRNKLVKFKLNERFISVNEIYRLAISNLIVKKIDDNEVVILVNPIINIPNSYTKIISIIKLLEYGSLSVNKYGLLSSIENIIALNIDDYYDKFKIGVD